MKKEMYSLLVTSKADRTIGIFEDKTFSKTINKAHPHMKKINNSQ